MTDIPIKTYRIFFPDRIDEHGGAVINESILVTAPNVSVKDGSLVVWSDDSCYIRKAWAPGYWECFEEVQA